MSKHNSYYINNPHNRDLRTILIESDDESYVRTYTGQKLPDRKLYFLTDFKPTGFNSPVPLLNVPRMPSFRGCIPKLVYDELLHKEAFLVYEYYLESGEQAVLELYKKCLREKFPTSQIVLLGSSYDYPAIAQKYATKFNTDCFTVLVHNFFEKDVKKRLLLDYYLKNKNNLPYFDKSPNLLELESVIDISKFDIHNPLLQGTLKRYVFLNHRSRPHRLALFCLLKQQGLLDHGYVSFLQDFNIEKDVWNKTFSFCMKHFQEPITSMLQEGYDVYKDTPFLLDEVVDSENPGDCSNVGLERFFSTSLIHLVSETFFSYKPLGFINMTGNTECRFITEKTYKAIAYKQPFMLITLPNTLPLLKRLGYKTFDGIIDESYDSEEDDTLRLFKIIKELKRICELDDKTLQEYKNQLIPIVEHNFQVLLNKKDHIDDLK